MRRLFARLLTRAARAFHAVVNRLLGRNARRSRAGAEHRTRLMLAPMESRDHTGQLTGGLALAALGYQFTDPIEGMALAVGDLALLSAPPGTSTSQATVGDPPEPLTRWVPSDLDPTVLDPVTEPEETAPVGPPPGELASLTVSGWDDLFLPAAGVSGSGLGFLDSNPDAGGSTVSGTGSAGFSPGESPVYPATPSLLLDPNPLPAGMRGAAVVPSGGDVSAFGSGSEGGYGSGTGGGSEGGYGSGTGGGYGSGTGTGSGSGTGGGSSSGAIGAPESTVPLVLVVAADPTASELGGSTGQFRIQRVGPTSQPLRVHFALSGTATSDVWATAHGATDEADYGLSSNATLELEYDASSDTVIGSALIPAGFRTVVLTVRPVDDDLAEPESDPEQAGETVGLDLTPDPSYSIDRLSTASVLIADNRSLAPTNGTGTGSPGGGSASGTGTDPVVTIRAVDGNALEAGGTAAFEVRRTGPTDQPLTVYYRVMSKSTATGAGVDYDLSGDEDSIVIPAGQASVVLTVTPRDDLGLEGPESVWIELVPLPGRVTGRAWHDLNGDGARDSDEPALANVTVTLVLPYEERTTATDETGRYTFDDVEPGTYTVRFAPPAGAFLFTLMDQTADDRDSDADPYTGETEPFTVAAGGGNDGIDAGFFELAQVSGRMWVDADGNGQRSDSEEPAALTVRLYDKTGELVEERPGTGGAYTFSNLTPGEYKLQFGSEADTFTLPKKGPAETDSDADGNGRVSFTLRSGVRDRYDTGVVRGIGGRVWEDWNGDGVQQFDDPDTEDTDELEPGLVGVTVSLEADGTTLATETGPDGRYRFDTVPTGTYTITVTKPGSTYAFTAAGQGDDPLRDSDADENGVIAVPAGTARTGLDAGLYLGTSILGLVWEDLDGNGQRAEDDPATGAVEAEPLVPGAGVELIRATDLELEDATTTDGNGWYEFTGLAPGKYYVRFIPPAGSEYEFTSQKLGADRNIDSDPDSAGETDWVTVASGKAVAHVDAGLYRTATLGDRVWLDANGNGTQDGGEGGVAGVEVALVGWDEAFELWLPIAWTVTDAGGGYQFADVAPGEYKLSFRAPEGYAFTQFAKNLPFTDSDAAPDGLTAAFTVTEGTPRSDLDAGLVVAVGDRVWLDANADGVQDADEPGQDGWTATLEKSDGAGGWTQEGTRITADGGYYQFTAVSDGNYRVTFSKDDATGYQFSTPAGGSATFTLADGKGNTGLDAGVYKSAAVQGVVWEDVNGNGSRQSGEGPVAGVRVSLWDVAGEPVDVEPIVTGPDGSYQFPGLKPSTYFVYFEGTGWQFISSDLVVSPESGEAVEADIGAYRPVTVNGFVWDDTNPNGQQDSGEVGRPDVVVELQGAGATVSTKTDTAGRYTFEVRPGGYALVVSAPAGQTFTKQDRGDDATDSDVSVATAGSPGGTVSLSLTSGQSLVAVDAGFVPVTPNKSPAAVPDSAEVVPGSDVTVAVLNNDSDPDADPLTITAFTQPAGGGTPVTVSGDGKGLVFTAPADFTGPAQFEYTVSDGKGGTATATVTVRGPNRDPLASPDTVTLYEDRSAWVDVRAGDTDPDADPLTVTGIGAAKYGSAVLLWGHVLYVPNANFNGTDTFTYTVSDGRGGSASATVTVTVNPVNDAPVFTPGAYQSVATGAGPQTVPGWATNISAGPPDEAWQALTFSVSSGNSGLFSEAPAVDVSGTLTYTPAAGMTGTATVTVRLTDDGGTADGGTNESPPQTFTITVTDTGTDTGTGTGTGCGTGSGTGAGVGSISGLVWDDDGDGFWQTPEGWLYGMTVQLLDGNGSVVSSTTTDWSGYYAFAGLASGPYVVEFFSTIGYAFSPATEGSDLTINNDADPTTGRTKTLPLGAGDNLTHIDAGLHAVGTGTGTGSGSEIGTGTGCGTGIGSETGIGTGEGCGPGTGSETGIGTGTGCGTGEGTGIGTGEGCGPGTGSETGIGTGTGAGSGTGTGTGVGSGSIGDMVWYDTTPDGVWDPSTEPGKDGVTVELWAGSGGPLLQTAWTFSGGHYSFTGLADGDYEVRFGAVPGFTYTTLDTFLVHLGAGSHIGGIDAGLTDAGSGGSGSGQVKLGWPEMLRSVFLSSGSGAPPTPYTVGEQNQAGIVIHDDDSQIVYSDTHIAPGAPVTGTTDQPITESVLATFTDADQDHTAANYTASVDWGDGSEPGAATVVTTGTGTFQVRAAHTFTVGGVFPVTVTVTANYHFVPNDPDTEVVYSRDVVTHLTAVVAPGSGPVLAPIPLNTVAGEPLPGFELTLSPSDPLWTPVANLEVPPGPEDRYSAEVFLGNGGGPLDAKLVPNWAGSGLRVLIPSYAYYPLPGNYRARVVVRDSTRTMEAGGDFVSLTDVPVTVADPPPSGLLGLTTSPVYGTEQGSRLGTLVASFVAPPSPGTLSATIDWDDGSEPDDAVLVVGGGYVSVLAPAGTFREPGSYGVTVTIRDDSGPLAVVGTTALVDDRPVERDPLAPAAIERAPGAPGDGEFVLAGLVSADPGDVAAAGYKAWISWGDGGTSEGTVYGSAGRFWLGGDHGYNEPGAYLAVARVWDARSPWQPWEVRTLVTIADQAQGAGADARELGVARVESADALDDVRGWMAWNGTDELTALTQVTFAGEAQGLLGTDQYTDNDGLVGYYTVSARGTAPAPGAADAPGYLAPETYYPWTEVVQGEAAGSGTWAVRAAEAPLSALPGFPTDVSLPMTLVLTFADPVPGPAGVTHEASIDWGDGTRAPGFVTADPIDPTRFEVRSAIGHSYTAPGEYQVSVLVSSTEAEPADGVFRAATLLSAFTVPVVGFQAYQRRDEVDNATWVPAGPSGEMSVNTGAVRLWHALDLDRSPGTGVGRDPHLVYNSATVNPRPVIEARVPLAGPARNQGYRLRAELSGLSATAKVELFNLLSDPATEQVIAVQPDAALPTGAYPWTLTVTVVDGNGDRVPGTPQWVRSDVAQVVNTAGSQFGTGW
ncbi:MAG TPA: SdrD B-like domain-containing protein, partial [Gemmata sp.]